ncbi:L,D-transpeptidase [Actinospica sp.]|uniref:L,D-transpeptidase n=1 Tax=Actinospica sp. TaxID=1872142 RepID=UPI002B9F4D82|nr:Ig-like domain-containing protein [Actinospica sp.]HWG22768.1 Ig-like domain-containing protein [Actinospica sp.]
MPKAPDALNGALNPAVAGAPATLLNRRNVLLAGGAGVVVIGGVLATIAATGSASGSPSASGTATGAAAGAAKSSKASASASPSVPPPTVATVPVNGATGVDPSKAVSVQVLGGTIESVSLSGQQQTSGTLSSDTSSWTSDNVLNVDTGYTLTIVAKNSAGHATTSNVAFHTLAPSSTFGVSSVVPPRGSTVGVGQPIRVTFSNYVPTEYQAALEKACVVTTTPAVKGAWYWVSNDSSGAVADWRPENFWPVGTKVSIAFNLNGVRLGSHQFGVKDYASHDFGISSRDLRLIIDKDKFQATCYQDGKVVRTFPIDTGQTTAETFVTYTGTMAVLGKGNPVEMKGNYGGGDVYDDFVNWATQITWSGTYVHAAPWDSEIGSANDDSHGCVHCHTADAEWFYNQVIDGDVVTINGTRTRTVAVDNGICTFTLDWAGLVKGSAYGPTLNGKPVSA